MVNYIKSFLRKVSIKERLLFGFLLLPLFVMIICFLFYYNFSIQMILAKNKESSTQSVTMMEEIFHLRTTQIEEEIINFSNEPIVFERLQNPEDKLVQAEFHTYVEKDKTLKNRIALLLFNKDGNLLYQDRKQGKYPTTLVKQKEDISWSYLEQENVVFLTKKIMNQGQVLGYVSQSFHEQAISSTFTESQQSNNMFIIVDQNNSLLFGQANIKKGTTIDTTSERIKLDTRSYYQTTKNIEGMDWKVVNLVKEDYVLAEMHNFRNMLIMYGLAIIILEMILSTFVFNSIYDPILNILKSMRELDEKNLINSKVKDNGRDELHELSDNFNELLNRVQELLNTVKFEQEQKRETQIQLLQAQINPHFLFNTLNTLHYLAILNEDNPVSEGISALSKLLRNTIVDSNEYVYVEEEIENVVNYVVIQKLRFGDLFETVYNIDKNVQHCQILKFLLQPIVENSILHAFEEDCEHQLLTIRAKAEGIYLKIEIGDNGKGFHLNNEISGNPKLSGIGISNIQERIRLMYGEEYSMTIQSEVNVGTIVTLLLPFMEGGSSICTKF